MNGKTSDIKTRLQYWTREKKNKETEAVFHEFHVKCIFENLDVSSFTTTDKLECHIGVQRTIPALRDWSVIEIPVVDASTDVDTAISGWKCIDMHQPEDALADPPVVDAGGYQNCYIYRAGSNIVNGASLESSSTARLLTTHDQTGAGSSGTTGDTGTTDGATGTGSTGSNAGTTDAGDSGTTAGTTQS